MDEQGFTEFYDSFAGEVHAYFARRVGGDLAEDLVAETFAVVWRRRQDVPSSDVGLRRWSRGVARNILAHAWRGRARQAGFVATVAPMAVTAEADVADRVAGSMDALGVFARLRPEDQEILRVVAWDGLSGQEAADVVGCTMSAFHTRLCRARSRLEEELGRADPDTVTPGHGGLGREGCVDAVAG